ncbi:MAG: AraC family transcriptional regulator, partial [Myxococcales bacterium]|nr:AraC family transcriptional regulator [Myxococcales bacterium]
MSEPPALPGAYVRDLVELTARWNVRADQLVEGLPVALDALRDPATRVPVAVCAEIIERAVRLTGEPALALYVGWQMRLSSHGFLGFAAMTASTVREAIDLAVRFAATRTTAVSLDLYVEGDTASLVIEEHAELDRLREFALLGLIVGLWQLGQALTGRRLEGVAECAFAAPAYIARVPFVAGLVRFGAPTTRLVFPAALLDTPLVTADPVATQLARAQCERELAAIVDAGLPGRV